MEHLLPSDFGGSPGGFEATPGLSVPNPDALKFLTAQVISGRLEIHDVMYFNF